MSDHKDILRIVGDRKSLNAEYERQLAYYKAMDNYRYSPDTPLDDLGFRPRVRGYMRKGHAYIEVWEVIEFSNRERGVTAPRFYVRIFVDKDMPVGASRRLAMLNGTLPEYVWDGRVQKIPGNSDTV